MTRFIVGAVAFGAVIAVGWFVLGIHPSLAEGLLIAIACGVSTGIEEGMK
jgi:hypothetical protein